MTEAGVVVAHCGETKDTWLGWNVNFLTPTANWTKVLQTQLHMSMKSGDTKLAFPKLHTWCVHRSFSCRSVIALVVVWIFAPSLTPSSSSSPFCRLLPTPAFSIRASCELSFLFSSLEPLVTGWFPWVSSLRFCRCLPIRDSSSVYYSPALRRLALFVVRLVRKFGKYVTDIIVAVAPHPRILLLSNRVCLHR